MLHRIHEGWFGIQRAKMPSQDIGIIAPSTRMAASPDSFIAASPSCESCRPHAHRTQWVAKRIQLQVDEIYSTELLY